MWHPWRALRRRTDIDVHWTGDLPAGVRGVTDGQRIWIDDRQLQAERRCTLTHELLHVELGHTGCVSPAEEAAVRQAAARRLIAMSALLDALRWSEELEEVADELWVDLDTLYARLDALTLDERAQIAALYAAVEGGC